jgi:hypothetical protein
MASMFFTLLLFPSLMFAQSVQPGVWQAETSLEINGISLPTPQESQCISESEAKDIKSTIVKELAKKGCAPTKWIVKGQKVEVSLKCSTSSLEAKGNLHGSVGAKNYDLKGEAEGTYEGIPSQASILLKGKWIKSCTK